MILVAIVVFALIPAVVLYAFAELSDPEAWS